MEQHRNNVVLALEVAGRDSNKYGNMASELELHLQLLPWNGEFYHKKFCVDRTVRPTTINQSIR